MSIKKIPKAQLTDYFVLVARVWLAYILLDYGWGKLTDGQFGVTAQELNTPLKDTNLFRLSWFLADHQPFKSFIGVSQIITALLLLYNRTLLLGAFIAIPIWLNILAWDISFMGILGNAFIFRLSWYLLLTFFIILHYKEKVLQALRLLTKGPFIQFRYPLWAYLAIPVLGFCLDIVAIIPNSIMMIIRQLMSKEPVP